MEVYDNKIGVIICFEKPLEIEEYNELFDKSYGNLSDENKREIHLEYQQNIINMFEQFYLKNDSSVMAKLRYIDMIDDLGFDEEENQFLYSELERAQLEKILGSLCGEEILYKKPFKIENFRDLEIILKFQLRTFRIVDFYFEKLNLLFKGSYEYQMNIYGDYKENEYNKILKENNLYYKTFEE